jgi:hypothetical protein
MQQIQSQNRAILAHLRAGNTITTPEARALCECERLSARIHDIREILEFENKGEYIETEMLPFVSKSGRKGWYGRYSLWITLKCDCGFGFTRPQKYVRLNAINTNVIWRWNLTYCDTCLKKRKEQAISRLPEIIAKLAE